MANRSDEDFKKWTSCTHSLYSAIQQAGGDVCCFSPQDLERMPAIELLNTCARNDIQFSYHGNN